MNSAAPFNHNHAPTTDAPIGVFDSGVGGLSVLRAIHQELPAENLVYLADSGYAPYGNRDADFITDRATVMTEFMVARGVKAIVIACNTATVVAVQQLRAWCPVPVVAIEPAIKPAAQATRSGVIGVLATSQTLASANVARLCSNYGQEVKILLQPCPGLAEQVETGALSSQETRQLLSSYLLPLLNAHADTIVLGCTHYPFLAPLIRDIIGREICLIDPATAVAKELARRISGNLRGDRAVTPARIEFLTSSDPLAASRIIGELWGESVTVQAMRDAKITGDDTRVKLAEQSA